MQLKHCKQFQTFQRQQQRSVHAVPLLLLLLSLLLLLGYQRYPGWQNHLNPVFAALIFGLAAVFLLGLCRTGQRCLAALTAPKQPLMVWQQQALRWGIVLCALNISPSALLEIAPWQFLKLLLLVVTVLALALWIGRRWFQLPTELVLLVSAGLSFCGTSAIFATHSMRAPNNDQQQSQAYLTQSLAAVLLMGLFALGFYSLILQQSWLGSAELAWLIGSTAPEVAQAVAAGSQLAEHAPEAIIAKLSRVCLLLPFLAGLSLLLRKKQSAEQQNSVVFPWFILLFVLLLLLQLLISLPSWLQHVASLLSQGCLIFAMLATALQTKAQDLRQCSMRLFGFAALVLLLLFGLAFLLL